MNIILTTDFSFAAHKAIQYALHLFDHTKNHFTLLHAVDIPHAGLMLSDDFRNELTFYGEEQMSALKSTLESQFPDLNIEYRVEVGPLRTVLDKYQTRKKLDFLVMGTNGTSGLFERLVGSNTLEMVQKIPVPALVVPAKARVNWATKMLLSAKEIDESDQATIQKYFTAIRSMDTKVDLFTIGKVADFKKEELHLEFLPEELIEHCSWVVEEPLPDVFLEEQILGFADLHEYDVVAVLPHERNFFERLLHRSVTKGLLEQSALPVLIVR